MDSLNWVSSHQASCWGFPLHAVHAGHDIDGAEVYVGRAYFNGDLIPAKVILHQNIAYIPYGGDEIAMYDFEILCGTGFHWVRTSSCHIPLGAICAGHECNGVALYVGRAAIGGSLTTGKVHPSHGCIYVPFDGAEIKLYEYEVLVQSSCGDGVFAGHHGPQTSFENDSHFT